MAALLLLLLLSLGAMFSSTSAQGNNYNNLSESYRRGVDLALEKLHSHAGIQHHFVFLRSLSTSDIQVVFTAFSQSESLKTHLLLKNILFLSAWFWSDVHLPPLLPQSHHLSKRNGGLHRVSPEKRQSEFHVLSGRRVWIPVLTCAVLFVRPCSRW